MATKFQELAELCDRLEVTSSRISMVNLVAGFLKTLGFDEVEPAIRMVIGCPLPSWDPRRLNVSYVTLINVVQKLTGADYKQFLEAFHRTGDAGAAAKLLMESKPTKRQQILTQTPLTINEVYRGIESIAEVTGSGSRVKKGRLVEALFSRATPIEVKYLLKNLGEEMRHGFNEGLMEEAIARAFDVTLEQVRRANMLTSDLGLVAKIAKGKGKEGLEKLGVTLFHPIKPMLAEAAQNVKEALEEHGGTTSLEYKLDGARVQIHKSANQVGIFSRHLADVTDSLPDIVKLIKQEIKANTAIVEGELIAVGFDGKPRPFQFIMQRFRRVRGIEEKLEEMPVTLYLFDALYVNGQSLIDLPYLERRKRLIEIAGRIPLTGEIVASNAEEAQQFFDKSLTDGHEGLVAKQFDSAYTPGVRGKKWLKLKRILDTLDLVIVAADYGYGYRHAWLSDYYLAARDTETNKLEVIGKCFTGLTNDEIKAMTQRLKELAIAERGRTVIVQPKIVLEIAFSEIQKSPHYKGGYALRFARILRIREDKSAEEADTIQRVKQIYDQQFKAKSL